MIRSGGTIHGAIAIANVLRKDVLAWRRELPHFAAALEQAFSERDLMHRERVMALVDQAYQTLGDILRDDKASPSVQFKAARFIIEQATPHIPSERNPPTAAKPAPVGAQMPPNRAKMPNAADFAGFSEECPCGSGKKFTDCCLPKVLSGAA
ncbi:MAG: SEC-C metal-binding domain-containing protein [Bryobacteraceae bacterium]